MYHIESKIFIDFNGTRDNHLPLIEVSYNNSYLFLIAMAPSEALYGKRCTYRVGWLEVCESSLLVAESIFEAIEKVWVVIYRFKTSYSRQKSYADNRRRDLDFEIGDHAY